MIKAVFLDLDSTLLRIDTDVFVRDYIMGMVALTLKLHPALADSPISVGKGSQIATRAVMTNLDPDRSNIEIYLEGMLNTLGLSPDQLTEIVTKFQGDSFALLGKDAGPAEGAQELIDRLATMGLRAVIATNPVFNLDAVMQRLSWAGLDNPPVPYAFISNIDELHFGKPNPHYYEELLARVGVEPEETIMVGDNLSDDILPAAQAGINTFWINAEQPLPAEFPAEFAPDGIGSLADFERKVSEGWLTGLTPRPRTIGQVIPRLMGNVGALYGLVETIKPEFWLMRPDPNEWSPLEIVCHLRDSERNIQRPRLQRIASEDNPFISQAQPSPGPGERDLSGEDGPTALREFWNERCITLNFLHELTPEQWSAPARHSIFGPTTLLEMAHFTARHDHLHINQLCETVGRCRKELF